MRLLLTTDAVGGVWRYSLELASALPAEVVLAVLGPAPDAAQRREAAAVAEVVETGLPLDWTATDLAALQAASASLADLAHERGVTLVHLHAPALVADAAWPVPVVAVAHSCVATWWNALRADPLPPDLAWRAAATAAGLGRANAVIAPSHAFAADLRAVYASDLRLTVVANGRRPLPVAPLPRPRAALGIGRLWDEAKNFAALDACAARLDLPVHVAGPGDVAFRHLRPLGVLDQAGIARALAGAGVFVSLARYEPFGLAVLEAATAGLPLVLSDIATFRELWHGAAVLVDPADTDAAIMAIRAVLDQPHYAARMAAQARSRAQRYSLDAMARGTAAVHRAVQ